MNDETKIYAVRVDRVEEIERCFHATAYVAARCSEEAEEAVNEDVNSTLCDVLDWVEDDAYRGRVFMEDTVTCSDLVDQVPEGSTVIDAKTLLV